ncbi:MAG: glycosyltransferase family 2 protein [Bacteriovoracaceae bacterium]|jgi:glycosyltransferase involved in cell wall biosynthesis|nr:glycosyltransferase family 2 protein [Bacteriovoracaceae bacterium]
MYKEHTVAAVIPAYNESTQIKKVITTMPDYVDHIVITDDCSKDNTVEIIESCLKDYPKVVLIKHEKNQGVGGAIATGYKWARDNNIDTAVVMAGDGQMNPKDLPDLLDPVVEGVTDYSKANRLIVGQSHKKIPKIRFFGNSALSFLTKIASGYWHVADSQTGYTVANKKVLHTLDWDNMYKRYGQPNDVLVKLNVHNFRVMDIAQEPVYNVGEASGINIKKAVFSIGWLIVKLFFWRLREKYIIRDFHPLVLFYMMSFLFMFLSVILFLRLILLWISQGTAPELTFIALLFTFGTSFQSAFFAMWMDMDYNRKQNFF